MVSMFNCAIGHKSLPKDLIYEITKAGLGQNERVGQAIAAG
jgi:hypothetical protein